MKKVVFLCLCCFHLNTIIAQTTFGYATNPPVANATLSSTTLNLFLITIPADVQIGSIGLNVTSLTTTTDVVCGIYNNTINNVLANSNLAGTTLTTGPNTIPLLTPITLTAGNYYIAIQGNNDFSIGTDGTTSGNGVVVSTNTYGTFPTTFGPTAAQFNPPNYSAYLIEGSTTTASSAPIPTLSQWGLLILGLLIMNLSVFYVQRRELI